MLWIVLSVWPSVSGWNAVEKLIVVPRFLMISCQKWLMKRGSLSQVILMGTPCKRTMLSRYSLATAALVVSLVRGNRCVCLLNLSTTTKIEVPCFEFGGRSVMKSIDTCYHGAEGTYRGYSRPYFLPCLGLIRWHRSKALMYCCTCHSRRWNQYFCLILSIVLLIPTCPVWSWCS